MQVLAHGLELVIAAHAIFRDGTLFIAAVLVLAGQYVRIIVRGIVHNVGVVLRHQREPAVERLIQRQPRVDRGVVGKGAVVGVRRFGRAAAADCDRGNKIPLPDHGINLGGAVGHGGDGAAAAHGCHRVVRGRILHQLCRGVGHGKIGALPRLQAERRRAGLRLAGKAGHLVLQRVVQHGRVVGPRTEREPLGVLFLAHIIAIAHRTLAQRGHAVGQRHGFGSGVDDGVRADFGHAARYGEGLRPAQIRHQRRALVGVQRAVRPGVVRVGGLQRQRDALPAPGKGRSGKAVHGIRQRQCFQRTAGGKRAVLNRAQALGQGHSGKRPAALERPGFEHGHALRNVDALQAAAHGKGPAADFLHAVRQLNFRNIARFKERIIGNFCHAFRHGKHHRVRAGAAVLVKRCRRFRFARGCAPHRRDAQQRSSILRVQRAVHGGIGRVARGHGVGRKAAAHRAHVIQRQADFRDRCRDVQLVQRQPRKRPLANRCNALAERDLRQAALRKRALANGGAVQLGLVQAAVQERIVADAGELAGQRDGFHPAVHKGAVADGGHRVRQGDACKLGAAVKGLRGQRGQPLADGGAGQRRTLREGVEAHLGHAVGDGDGGERAAVVEGAVAKAFYAVRQFHRLQPGAAEERALAHRDKAARQADRGQAGAVVEGEIADFGHAVRDGDGGQALVLGKGALADFGHRRAAQLFGQHQRGVSAVIAGDNGGAIRADGIGIPGVAVRKSSRGEHRDRQQHRGKCCRPQSRTNHNAHPFTETASYTYIKPHFAANVCKFLHEIWNFLKVTSSPPYA